MSMASSCFSVISINKESLLCSMKVGYNKDLSNRVPFLVCNVTHQIFVVFSEISVRDNISLSWLLASSLIMGHCMEHGPILPTQIANHSTGFG